MRYKFGICGPFDFNEQGTGGQSVKTREFYYALCEEVGKDKILILESTDYRRNPLKFIINYVGMMHHCDHTVIFPAQNGIRFLAPLSSWFKGKGKVHYSVIGGWLPEMIREKPALKKYLANFDTILVETNIMKKDLEEQGLINVKRLLNFKRLVPSSENDIGVNTPLRLCYFSRVAKQKGIEDAIEVVKRINHKETRCCFDIYGPVIPEYEKEFEVIKQGLPAEIKYCGKIAPEESIHTLKHYDVQLFPTRYPTEGIPGSIVDSYFAGVPVLAAKWNSFDDVVIDGITGVGYTQGSLEAFYLKLDELLKNRARIETMKRNCLREADKYTPKKVIQSFFELIA